MRVKLLQARGWEVVSIPFFEWRQGSGSQAAQQAYLRSKLPPKLLQVCSSAVCSLIWHAWHTATVSACLPRLPARSCWRS